MLRHPGHDVADQLTAPGGEECLTEAIEQRFATLATDQTLVEAALPRDGWLRDYVEFCTPTTEAPRLFHLAVGLSCLSCAVGRRAYLQVGPARLYGNTFIALIGSQGIVRKSTALHAGAAIIEDTFPDILYEGDATPEALRSKVLHENPERLLFADELSALLGGADYQRHIRRLLATLHDCPDRLSWSRVGAGDGVVERPTVSVVGASTFAWLREATTVADVGGGIMSRFIWAVAEHDGRLLPMPEEPCPRRRASLQTALRDIREHLGDGQRRMGMNDAQRVHERFYMSNMRKANREAEEGIGGFIARLTSAHAPKLAMLMTLAQDPEAREVSPDLYADHVVPLVELLERGMRAVVGGMVESESQQMTREVFQVIQRGGPEGVSRRDVLRRLRLQVRDLAPIVDTLVAQELVVEDSAGQSTRFRAVDQVSPCPATVT